MWETGLPLQRFLEVHRATWKQLFANAGVVTPVKTSGENKLNDK